ncbi:MAG: hypothetical protein M3O46_13975, partial [Myxococcota bacterium]|nr:hypothetical protein [Myxococcota bacterium]
FRDERVGRIIADDTPVKLVDTTRLVLHIVPLAAASRGFAIDLRKLKAGNLRPVYCDSWASSFNLDGLLVVGDPNGDMSHTYTQFFRDGSVEVVLTTIADEKHVYPSTRIEPHMVKTTKGYLPILVDVGAAYPFALTATLLGMKGLGPPPGNWGERTGTLLPRDVVFLPDVVLETDDADFASVLRPTFDALWQSLGHEGSPNYSAKGEWTGKTK